MDEISIRKFVSVGTAAKVFGVTPRTIRRWCDEGIVKFIITPSKQRRIDTSIRKVGKKEIESSRKTSGETPIFKKDICYCRVSTSKQKDDLERQVSFMVDKFPGYTIYKDIGSGLNFKRRSFLSLLEQAEQGLLQSVTITSKDRLCRFGFELVEWIFARNDVKLVVLNKEDSTPEQELTRDILTIMQVFNSRWNGKRRYSIKHDNQDQEIQA